MNAIEPFLLNSGVLYSWPVVVVNSLLALILGLGISAVYKHTHHGLSYSQSFVIMLVLVTMIATMAMMVIGNNIARAFALVGALSIIRFRTVIKDTRDIAFIFAGLVAGMAAGTSSYFIAIFGTALILVVVVFLHLRNYGSLVRKEFILRLEASRSVAELVVNQSSKYVETMTILEVEGSPSTADFVQLTYDVVLKTETEIESFLKDIRTLEGVRNVRLIASKQDVDY